MAPLRQAAVWTVAAAIASFTNIAAAADGAFYGLLRSRDLSPFGFLRLDMRPAHAVSIEPGTWAIETQVDYQNTWALSPRVESYLNSLEGRRELGPDELHAIQALPGENYLVDIESSLLDVTLHYKLSSLWTAYVTASAIRYGGGFLDGTIEQFHDTFGFASFGRPAVRRNDTNLIYDLKSFQLAFFEPPTDGGLTDPTIGLRYVGLGLPEPWKASLEVAAKVPIGEDDFLLSTGRTDYGFQASLQRFGQNHAFYVDAAAVYYAGASQPVPQEAQVVPTLILGYELQLSANTNFNAQAYYSESVYTRATTDLKELLIDKYQLSVGLRHRMESFLLTFGFTENLQNLNNTPDIGFQLGIAFIPAQKR
jgi:Protein of unknown function (DUF3187)